MATRDDGGTAFPVSIPGCGDNGQEGMSLRDWFAGQALANPALCTGKGVREYDLEKWFRGRSGITEFEIAAEQARRFADAMLAARKTEGE